MRIIRLFLILLSALVVNPHRLAAQWQQLGVTKGVSVTDLLINDSSLYTTTGLNNKTLYEYDGNGSWTAVYHNFYQIASHQDSIYVSKQSYIINTVTETEYRVSGEFLSNLTSDGENLYTSDSDSLYRSADGGRSWTVIRESQPFLPLLVDEQYIWILDESGTIHRSSDKGDSWEALTTLNDIANVNVFKKVGGRIYLSMSGIGMLISSDEGMTFNNAEMLSNLNTYLYDVESYGGRIYVAGSNSVLQSSDLNFWSNANLPLFIFPRQVIEFEGKLFMGSDKGIFTIDNTDGIWQPENEGELFQPIQNILVHKDTLFTIPILGNYYFSTDGVNWEEDQVDGTYDNFHFSVSIGDSLVVDQEYSTDRVIWERFGNVFIDLREMFYGNGNFYALQAINSSRPRSKDLYRLEEDGTWQPITDFGEQAYSRSVDVVGDSIMISTQNELAISLDGGDTWDSLAIPPNVFPDQSLILDGHLFIKTSSGIYRSDDMGESWEKLTITLSFSFSITKFEHLLIATNADKALWVSENYGNTWRSRTGNLPFHEFNRFARYKDYVYTGSGRGGFARTSEKGVYRVEAEKFFGPCKADSLSTSATICEGETFKFGFYSLSAPGDYQVTFESGFNCDSIVSLTLDVIPTITSNETIFLCEGDSLLFGNDKIGSTGSYMQTFMSTTTGCDSIVNLDLTITQPDVLFIDQVACEGDTIIFGDQEILATGEYTQMFQNSLGCDSTVVLGIGFQAVETEISAAENVISVQAQSGATYQWFDCATSTIIEGEQGPTFMPSASGSYYAEVTIDQCQEITECLEFELVLATVNSIDLKVFPNPVTDELHFRMNDQLVLGSYKIFDLAGETVLSGELVGAEKVNVRKLSSGLYFASMLHQGQVYMTKFYVR